MTEKEFIHKNKDSWEELERLIYQEQKHPEKLHRLFVKVSSDLSYARTYFPRRSVKIYLNDLVKSIFEMMRTKRRFSFQSIKSFYSTILPQEIIRSKNVMLLVFCTFWLAVLIGAYSTSIDHDFPRLILGDEYVSMTDKNIAEGKPMNVYSDGSKFDGFVMIMTNNLRVSFIAFTLGILASIGTLFVMISNGIMVGAFQYYFYIKGVFLTSFLTIWIHGTIEISTIIIAGSAGLIIGNSLLFPGTYTRRQSLRIGAIRALYLLLSAVPLVIFAAFLEGFVTGIDTLPNAVKICIIVASLALILFIYVIKPYLYYKSANFEIPSIHIELPDSKINQDNDFKSSVLSMSLNSYNNHFETLLVFGFFPLLAMWIIQSIYLYSKLQHFKELNVNTLKLEDITTMISVSDFSIFLFFSIFWTTTVFITLNSKGSLTWQKIWGVLKRHTLVILTTTLLLSFPFFIDNAWVLMVVFFLPYYFISLLAYQFQKEEHINFGYLFKYGFRSYFSIIWVQIVGFLLLLVIFLGSQFVFTEIIFEVVGWVLNPNNNGINKVLIVFTYNFLIMLFFVPWFLFLYKYAISNYFKARYSEDIEKSVLDFCNARKSLTT